MCIIVFVVQVEEENDKDKESLMVSVTPSSPYSAHTSGSFVSITLSSPSSTYANGSIASLTILLYSKYRHHNPKPNPTYLIFTIETTNNDYF